VASRWSPSFTRSRSTYNNALNRQLESGKTYAQAARGLDAEGNPQGIYLHLHADQTEILRRDAGSLSALVRTMSSNIRQRVSSLVRQTASAQFMGIPVTAAVAGLGIVLVPWWRIALGSGLLLLCFMALQAAMLLSLHFTWDRYLLPLFPAMAIWAGMGTEGLARLGERVAPRWRVLAPSAPAFVATAAAAALVCALSVWSLAPVRAVGELSDMEDALTRAIGTAIADDARGRGVTGRPIIMGAGLAPAFYAGGTLRYLPHADGDRALSYLRRVNPQYIVLRESEAFQAPYLKQWMARNPAPECASALPFAPPEQSEAVHIWRWSCRRG
jgi:hypothetical protein